MSNTTTKTTEIDGLRLRVDNCLCVTQLEMRKAKPCFDLAFDFAEKALHAIETLRILQAGIDRQAAAFTAQATNGGRA